MKLGTNDISSVYLGTNAVQKVYLGANEVWSSYAYLLDDYSGAAAAYSLRLLRSAYSGSAIKVRRAVGSPSEKDIGFVNNELDVADLKSFCSGTNGFVVTWYDQSGNARDATQTTLIDQPQIVSSGSVILENGKPAIKFLNNKLETSIFTLSAQPITRMCVGKSNTTTADFIDGSASNRGFTGGSGGLNRLFAGTIFDSGLFGTNRQLFYGLFNGASSEIVVNGVSQGTGNPGSGGLEQVILGSHPTVRIVDLDGTMQEAIVYASNQNTNRTGIESNINDFYSIY